MNTNTVNPEAPDTHEAGQQHTEPPFRPWAQPAALRRPVQGRVLAGVAAGLARYLSVDATIIRIAFVVLMIVGGAGIPLYLAGLLLIPEEGSDQSIASSLIESMRSRRSA